MQPHSNIVTALRSGDRASALAELERLLAFDPHDSDLLGLKALAMAMNSQTAQALELARQAVSDARTPAQRIKHAGNLARLIASSGRKDELAGITGMDLPRLELLKDDEFDAAALENLCASLLLAGQDNFVAGYLLPVLDRPTAGWDIEQLWLKAAHGAGQNERLFARINASDYRWRDKPEAMAHAAIAADVLQREADAKRFYSSYLASAPAYAAPRLPSQILTVIEIAADPAIETLASPAMEQHFTGNFPSQLVKACADRYRFLSVFAGSPARSLASEVGAHEPAIILNNCVNGENLKRGELAKVEAQESALGLPVVNAAQQALHCTRVETADTLRGVANLIVPKSVRFRLEAHLFDSLRRGIRELFPFPVILRSVGQQEGANIHLARNDAELNTALTELLDIGCKDFYAIEYAGVEHENGFFRRIRAAFVDGTPTLIRGDYDDQWMVRGRKFHRILDHYRRDRALFDTANAVVEQPERIGEAAWHALLEVGRRIPLDVFGMDFDVDDEGRVVFFESNATMLLLSNAPKDLDYPQDAQQAFLKCLDTLFRKRAGLSLQ
ncbi:MAG: hypothetical protein WCJ41_19690 [Aestuariivirga sp.]|uniref:hypothetical protein n=1 Tax=Aestuariivirga sp. TaxID=2650926 RepID=UPI0030183965